LKKQILKIMFLAAEAEPFIKIGGLGDVAGSLPHALRALASSFTPKLELDIRLVIPFHGAIQRQTLDLHTVGNFTVAHAEGPIPGNALMTEINGLPVYLISGAPIPRDAAVYSEDTAIDGHKFTFFSLAALELAKMLDWQPDVIHANDWHTAPAIYAVKALPDPFFNFTATLLGLHNLPFMGENAGPAMEAFGLPPANDSALPWWAQSMPLPLGLLTADHIVAVSPTYAREILTYEHGAGLHEFLALHQKKISGILNGIDTLLWNPQTDQAIAANFDTTCLDARNANKTALASEFDLDPNLPLLAMVTRFDHQKGVDLIPVALRLLQKEKWQLIILGAGTPELEEEICSLESQFPKRFRAAIRFDALLSRRIYAGADILLIPSRYEPCGLAQMIAMRYGCVPVARSTGGLRDTIKDHNAQFKSGFLFPKTTSRALSATIRRALTAFEKKETWKEIQHNGMRQDFSWENSARQYIQLYQSMLKTP